MKQEFSAAMRRATEAVRGGDLMAATKTIRAALKGASSAAASGAVPAVSHRVEDAEVVSERGPLSGFFAKMTPCAPCASAPGAALENMTSRTHRCAAGKRNYRLFIPASGEKNGVLMMLHGCKQNPEDFARGTRMNEIAEANGIVVIWPEQGSDANMMSCWNWFETAHQSRGRGEPAILASLAQAVSTEFAVRQDAVWVAGLSAGGAMAAVLGEAYPEVFSAIGIHSGLPAGAAHDTASAFAAMAGRGSGKPALSAAGPRIIVFHGDADRTVSPSNVAQLVGKAVADKKVTGRRGGLAFRRSHYTRADGSWSEVWSVSGAGHAWSGGSTAGTFSDSRGPDASDEMVRFFLKRP